MQILAGPLNRKTIADLREDIGLPAIIGLDWTPFGVSPLPLCRMGLLFVALFCYAAPESKGSSLSALSFEHDVYSKSTLNSTELLPACGRFVTNIYHVSNGLEADRFDRAKGPLLASRRR